MSQTYEPRYSIITRLDEHFMFMLQFIDGEVKDFDQEDKDLTKKWLVKLGAERETQSIEAKVNRNRYLDQLMTCINKKLLRHPFNASPPSGNLPDIEKVNLNQSMLQGNPDWLDRFLIQAQFDNLHIGGKDFETYLSTKLFENGRGACAYLAVSVQNKGDENAWFKITPNSQKEEAIQAMYEKESGYALPYAEHDRILRGDAEDARAADHIARTETEIARLKVEIAQKAAESLQESHRYVDSLKQ